VHVNHNVKCPPHYDSKNVGNSVLISFGDYSGGEIIIDGQEFNAYHQPIMFNGSSLLHYNKEHQGNKYSLVYYCM
jgi:hypothetical protein